jgi:hypothetical protein
LSGAKFTCGFSILEEIGLGKRFCISSPQWSEKKISCMGFDISLMDLIWFCSPGWSDHDGEEFTCGFTILEEIGFGKGFCGNLPYGSTYKTG